MSVFTNSIKIFILYCVNANSASALLLNNVDQGTYMHMESIIGNMNATIQSLEGKVQHLQQSKNITYVV